MAEKHRHLFITDNVTPEKYKTPKTGGEDKSKIPKRD